MLTSKAVPTNLDLRNFKKGRGVMDPPKDPPQPYQQ